MVSALFSASHAICWPWSLLYIVVTGRKKFSVPQFSTCNRILLAANLCSNQLHKCSAKYYFKSTQKVKSIFFSFNLVLVILLVANCICVCDLVCTCKWACCVSWVQLFASFHRVPLWLAAWPLMPEVPHQLHVTLVPDTLVFTASAVKHGPLQRHLSAVKEEVFVLPSLLGNCPQLKQSHTTLKTQACPQQMFVLRWLCSIEPKNRILM